MEKVLSLVKQLVAQAGMLGSIPKPIKTAILYMTVFVGIVVVFKYAKLDRETKMFLIVALIVLALIMAGYYAWKTWIEKQHNDQFGGAVTQHSSATPRGVSDPGQRARLDDLRKKFQSGVQAYKSRGKDLYKLPWYAIVGEPGSGKTEAIRHSNVGFPPGMQDEFQGVGGTINMNWWFTNHAVLLDTAGRLMFEEVKPGDTSEWKEFLTLLKKNRPTCPVNGLFLVIPSDSLIKDSADDIQRKAGKIAQQLDVIQRVLDVRFPVFVVVTKCDKINGFREFFDGLTDPQLQHQMMGWSNPEPLDEPFKPELVEKHLEQVAQRLRRRRFALMRDPVPENIEARRTDEMDTLFALPHSLELLSSRLRRYLETIFIAGEWSAKPLFLRGIYFSSSMREGSALDAELAEAIGVGVDDLPEGRVWERDRAYFLRDLFLEKVFKERGLVTRATNTKKMLRNQQIALFGLGFAALVVFLGIAWFARGHLPKDQGTYWEAVKAAGWHPDRYWKESIVPVRDGTFAATISTNSIRVAEKPVSLAEFHVRLRELAEKPLRGGLLFRSVVKKYNEQRLQAQRIVLEQGVVRPLIEGARQKMRRGGTDPGSHYGQPEALAALIQLEADLLARVATPAKGELNQERAQTFVRVFESYIAGREEVPDTNLVAALARTYTGASGSAVPWPPSWASGGVNSLPANGGINDGLELFLRDVGNPQAYETDWSMISSVRDAARTVVNDEHTMFERAKSKDEPGFLAARLRVATAANGLRDELDKVAGQPLFGGTRSLTNAYQKFQIKASASAALSRLQEINEAARLANKNKDAHLFEDIKARLETVQAKLSSRVKELLGSGDPKEFQLLEETCLADNGFLTRADLYAAVEKLRSKPQFTGGNLVGSKGAVLGNILSNDLGKLAAAAVAHDATLKAPFKDEFDTITKYHLELARKAQSAEFFRSYAAEGQIIAAFASRFPVIGDVSRIMTAKEFADAGKDLQTLAEDIDSLNKFPDERSEAWKQFVLGVKSRQAVIKALLDDNGKLGVCALSLWPMSDPPKTEEQWRGNNYRNIRLKCDGCSAQVVRTETDDRIGDVPVAQKLELTLMKRSDVASETFPLATDAWGPLWLIHKYKDQDKSKCEPDKTDPKGLTWLVEFPFSAPDAPRSLMRLKLKFERPLPRLEDWPNR